MRVDPKVGHALLTKPSWFVIVFFLNFAAVGFFAFFRNQFLAYVGCFQTRIKRNKQAALDKHDPGPYSRTSLRQDEVPDWHSTVPCSLHSRLVRALTHEKHRIFFLAFLSYGKVLFLFILTLEKLILKRSKMVSWWFDLIISYVSLLDDEYDVVIGMA